MIKISYFRAIRSSKMKSITSSHMPALTTVDIRDILYRVQELLAQHTEASK